LRNGSYVSEKFYLQVGANNPTFDLGLVRYRNLTITKKGSDGQLLDGAKFVLYGPYTDAELLSPIDLNESAPVATITSENGVASFTSTSNSSFMNYYGNYIVVETAGAADWYPANGLQAAGSHVLAAADYGSITGGGISDNNFFVLTARSDGESTGYTDSVTVTNRYEASGILQVTGTKELTGAALASDDFTFVMTSTDDPDFTTRTTTNGEEGSFTFSPVTYDFEDVGHTYHYTVTERNDGRKGIKYDACAYTLTVTVYNLGNGKLDIQKQLKNQGQACDSILFQNTSIGSLRIAKVFAGNATVNADTFTFTVTLKDRNNNPLSGSYSCMYSENASLTSLSLDAKGQADVILHGGESIVITGLTTGTKYTVSEPDYTLL
jgi:pilin isopeptide linkage protein